jgi:hypothetical protein
MIIVKMTESNQTGMLDSFALRPLQLGAAQHNVLTGFGLLME